MQNPKIYLKAYMLATAGFWDIDIASMHAYVQNFMWDRSTDASPQTDYFSQWYGFSFRHFVDPRNPISSAWFFWIFFMCAWYCAKQYGGKCLFIFTPPLGLWATLMIATPIAVGFRYISALMFSAPLIVIIPILLARQAKGGNLSNK